MHTRKRPVLGLLLFLASKNRFSLSFCPGNNEVGRKWEEVLTATPETLAPAVNGDKDGVNGGTGSALVEPIFQKEADIFSIVASRAATCLYDSDVKRDAKGGKEGNVASGATNWIDDASAFALKNALDKVTLQVSPSFCFGWSFCALRRHTYSISMACACAASRSTSRTRQGRSVFLDTLDESNPNTDDYKFVRGIT